MSPGIFLKIPLYPTDFFGVFSRDFSQHTSLDSSKSSLAAQGIHVWIPPVISPGKNSSKDPVRVVSSYSSTDFSRDFYRDSSRDFCGNSHIFKCNAVFFLISFIFQLTILHSRVHLPADPLKIPPGVSSWILCDFLHRFL